MSFKIFYLQLTPLLCSAYPKTVPCNLSADLFPKKKKFEVVFRI